MSARPGIDLAAIEVIFLSHWHFDHSGALPEAAGAQVALRRDAHALCGGFFFGSGAIARVTEYETSFAAHYWAPPPR